MPVAPFSVVIADDSARLRDLLRQTIEALPGVQVTGCAADGAEALDVVRRLKPDALVLDVRMPRASGFRVMEELRDSEELPAVIVCTNYAFPEYQARAMALGAAHFVDKGKDLGLVPGLIQHLVDTAPRRRPDAG
ncbi:MAG: response regulator [Gemmatimonadales bacterium]|nr:response regulator [Gemmatimonadales bacterium]